MRQVKERPQRRPARHRDLVAQDRDAAVKVSSPADALSATDTSFRKVKPTQVSKSRATALSRRSQDPPFGFPSRSLALAPSFSALFEHYFEVL
jgi:hypothetical protein